MAVKRIGLEVILLEKGEHPRVVIGESSTPLSNLLLEEFARRYSLEGIRSLSKWGSWQESYPEIACGLKRGFSFFHHVLRRHQVIDRSHQLLVAASPRDEIADTHWYRADFDHHLVDEAVRIGVSYLDRVEMHRVVENKRGMQLTGTRGGEEIEIETGFVVDASGPRGCLHRMLHLDELPLPDMPSTSAVYCHFTGVRRLAETGMIALSDQPPYSIDDAAVHHIFDGGWVWVLHFNNGVTSAGVVATDALAEQLQLSECETAWNRVLNLAPVLSMQFQEARPCMPFRHLQRVGFRSAQIVGRNWALLPSAAGFVDPLLSTGFPLALLGVMRLAEIAEHFGEANDLAHRLQEYAAHTEADLLVTSRLIGALYANFDNFPVFSALSLLYFATASYSESARRLGQPERAESFLLRTHPLFGDKCSRILERAHFLKGTDDSAALIEDVYRAIDPIDVAGLGNRSRGNWYPADAEDLLRSTSKIGVSREEVMQMLERCGFIASS